MFWRARTLLKSILFLFESTSLKTFISVRTWGLMWTAGKENRCSRVLGLADFPNSASLCKIRLSIILCDTDYVACPPSVRHSSAII